MQRLDDQTLGAWPRTRTTRLQQVSLNLRGEAGMWLLQSAAELGIMRAHSADPCAPQDRSP